MKFKYTDKIALFFAIHYVHTGHDSSRSSYFDVFEPTLTLSRLNGNGLNATQWFIRITTCLDSPTSTEYCMLNQLDFVFAQSSSPSVSDARSVAQFFSPTMPLQQERF